MEIKEFTRCIVPLRNDLLLQARRLTGNDNTAEDLVQEVMLKLWSIRSELDQHPNHKALAMTILRNKYTDQWRHQQFERPCNSNGHQEMGADERAIEDSDEMGLIRLIIDHLPPLQAKILRMKEIEGYEAEEIISITGCSSDSLRQNLSRARRKIREDYIKLTAIKLKRV